MNSSEDGSRPAEPRTKGPAIVQSATFRAAGFLGFWLVLTGGDPADLAVGLLATVAATWTSQRLMPAEYWHLHPFKFAGLILHFLHQSIGAGIDVALRALDPRLPLRPGFVVYQTKLPAGTRRNAFCSIMSLLPGTLPCGPADGGGLAIHCLDVTQPVVEQLSAEEVLYMQTPERGAAQ
jgi:multicomponent Na+:H+ antiporter subunit E